MGLRWLQSRYSFPVAGDTSIVTVNLPQRSVMRIASVPRLKCALQLLYFAKCNLQLYCFQYILYHSPKSEISHSINYLQRSKFDIKYYILYTWNI